MNEVVKKYLIIVDRDDIDQLPCFREGELDFNKVIPMPEELDIPSGPSMFIAIATYMTAKNTVPPEEMSPEFKQIADQFFVSLESLLDEQEYKDSENGFKSMRICMASIPKEDRPLTVMYEMGKKYVQNLKKYGHATGDSWKLYNWDSPTNAFNTQKSKDRVTFNTLVHPPLKVLRRLSELYPSKALECTIIEVANIVNSDLLQCSINELGDTKWSELVIKGGFPTKFVMHETKAKANTADD